MTAAVPIAPVEDVSPARLDVENLDVRYGQVTALRSVTFSVAPGEVLALLGPNGAGKSSLANALSGVVRPAVGSIKLDGREISSLSSHARVRRGVGHLPDSRAIFPSLSVAENLRMFFRGGRSTVRRNVERAYEVFPQLAQRKRLPARKLSGGEQQMLAFSRLIVAPPRLLIVDELSHGLAPGIVANLFASLDALRGSCSIIVVEQFVTRAVALADAVLVLSHGDIQHYGPAASFTPEMAAELYGLDASS